MRTPLVLIVLLGALALPAAVAAKTIVGTRHGDRLVGKVDAVADRKASVLRVHAIHEDVSFSRALTAAVRKEIEDLAAWLELDVR